jgi:exopolysaccharide biosynthesis polyprenyl glycosylphosphotransferase
MINEQYALFRKVVIFSDFCLITLALFIGYVLRIIIYSKYPLISTIELLPLAPPVFYLGLLPVLLICWWGLLTYFGMYKSFYIEIQDSLIIILKSALIGFIIFGSYIFILKMQGQVSRLVIGFTFILSIVLISLEKVALFYIFRVVGKRDISFKSSLIIFRRILIIGTGQRARRFIDLVKNNPGWGIKIVGLIDFDSAKRGEVIDGYKVMGSLEDLKGIIHNNVIDEAVFIVPRSCLDKIENSMQFCESAGLRINLAADLYKLKFSKAKQTDVGGFPLLTFESTSDKFGHLFIKRLFDFAFSGIVLVCLFLFFIIIAVIIKISSEGPVFYNQLRCGLYGRKFKFYKFRTMTVDAESQLQNLYTYNEMNGPVFKMTNDPRITKVGKWLRRFSIDELPQLWNVMKGDMSLVGPRPPIPEEVENYDSWQRRRLSMRPGITCLWQVSGRSKIADFNEWMRLDLEYIDQWSLGLDFKILLKTIPAVFFGIGAQ